MQSVNHRLATLADLPRLVEIYNQAILEGGCTADLEPYTAEQRRPWFDGHQREPFRIYVVEAAGVVAGYFYFSAWRGGRTALRTVAELSYYFDQSVRGKGLGSYAVVQAEQIARASDLRYLLAILLECNTASRSLLAKNGFRLAGRIPDIADLGDFVSGQLIMYKQLNKEPT